MLSMLRKARLKDKEMRVLMLSVEKGALDMDEFLTVNRGLDNAGKTTIVRRMMGEDISSISPTLGFIIKTIEYECYKLNVWDIGGQKTLRTYWRNYFEKTDTLIWVVDAVDRERLPDCAEELGKLLLEERLMGASLLVLLNKTDIPGSMGAADVRQGLGLDRNRTHAWHIVACSAVTGVGLDDGLKWVVDDARSRLFLF